LRSSAANSPPPAKGGVLKAAGEVALDILTRAGMNPEAHAAG
jgi:hypothetical protein